MTLPADGEIEITLKWQNNSHFECTIKELTEPVHVVIRADENGILQKEWPHIKAIIDVALTEHMKEIKEAMAQP